MAREQATWLRKERAILAFYRNPESEPYNGED